MDYKMFLTESKRDDFLLQYIPLLQKRGIETSVGQLKSYLLNKFGVEFGIHNLSKPSNYFFSGVARYYFEGLLTTNKRLNVLYPNVQDKPIQEICVRLDALVDILRNAYIDSVGTKFEQPEDFGTLPLDKLLKKYNKKINQYLGLDVKEKPSEEESQVDQSVDAGKNYTYEILYSYADAKKFNQWTTPGAWCITYGEQHYNAYVRRLKIHYVVFMCKGFENIPRKVGKGFTKKKPHDEYGNSLICVLQSNMSPEPIYITSRWNHGYGDTQGTEADHAYTKEEFLKVIGCDESVLTRCFEQWQETVKKNKENGNTASSKTKKEAKEVLRKFKYAQMMISNGAQLQDFCDEGYLLAGRFEKPMKSVLLVGMKSDESGDTYYTIFDRGQLKFDQYFVKGGGYRNKPDFKVINDVLVCLTNNDKTVFYNIKKRSVITADGVKTFTHVPYDLNERYLRAQIDYKRYYMVAASGNQIAVIDTQKGDFLTSPQGNSIFESIIPCQGRKRYHYDTNTNYRGHIEVFDIPDKGYLKMVYDSSAQEVYVYDLTTNSFLILNGVFIENGKINGEIVKWTISNRFTNPPKGYIAYENKLDNYTIQYRFLNASDGKLLNILGYTTFKIFENYNDIAYGFWPIDVERLKKDQYSDMMMFYDTQTHDLLKINGEVIVGDGKRFEWEQGYTKGWLLISPERNSVCYLYNPYTKQFYTDKNGNQLFAYYYNDNNKRNEMLIVNIVDNHYNSIKTIDIPPAQEYSEGIKENIKNNFNILLEKLYKGR